ncbi:MAG: cyclic nucleotide-binding domain-containing protein [Chloroflexi bacterium]|nr:cyclic nucleotide-binding domain-containing protein [Chloroflexota bacterium]
MDLLERLRRVPLFQALSDEDLALIAGLCEEHRVKPGMLLCRQGDVGATFFLIDEGEASSERIDDLGNRRTVKVLRPGDYIGVHSLFLAEPRDASVVAMRPMRLWTIRRADFMALLDQHPHIRRRLLVPEDIEARLKAPRYRWLERSEQVVYACRRHWVALAAKLGPLTFLALVLLLALAILRAKVYPFSLWIPLLIVLSLYGLIALWYVVDWFNDYFVVTTWRITHRERIAWLYEARHEVPLDRIQNLNLTSDFWGRTLGYGTLIIETAAAGGRMTFDRIPHPEAMRDAIWDQTERTRATRRAKQQHLIRDTLAARLGWEVESLPPELAETEETLDAFPNGNGEEAVQPRRLARLLQWMGTLEILPRSRIETPEGITWRKHWIFLLRSAGLPFLIALLAGPASVLGFFGWPEGIVRLFPPYPYILLVITVVSMGAFWWEATDWGNDLYIVTDERIIDLKKRPLSLSTERREASLGRIQDVRFEVPNFWAALLKYGNVIIQTAGTGAFTFERVADPSGVQNEIFRRLEKFQELQQERERARQRQDLADWFSVYDRLKQPPRPSTHRPQGASPSAEGTSNNPTGP